MTSRLAWLLAMASLAAGQAAADEVGIARQLADNPFSLKNDLLVPGSVFTIQVEGGFAATDHVAATLRYDVRDAAGRASQRTLPVALRSPKAPEVDQKRRTIEAELPSSIPSLASQSALGGFVHPYRATLVLATDLGAHGPSTFELPVRIPSVFWAVAWGIAVVLLLFFAFYLLVASEIGPPWNRGGWRLLSPLALTITPVGGLSLSKTQILIWSTVTAFGLVYVYFLTFSFLAISPQILVLLGIGGATAIATKVANDDASVARYMKLAGREKRAPTLADLVWSEGKPDVFKFQMLVFTLLTAFIVVYEILTKYAFPDIPENLVSLMGVSSGVYVGNKVVQRGQSKKVREDMEKAAQVIERGAETKETGETGKAIERLNRMLGELHK